MPKFAPLQLTELEPKFLKRLKDESGSEIVQSIREADGVMFLCPQCFSQNNKSNRGVHSMICWRPTVDQSVSPKPGRWNMEGENFENLTLTAVSPSILVTSGCMAHFYVRNGKVEDA